MAYCEDVDECRLGPCDHICINTPGSFRCICKPDYELESDGKSCWAYCPRGCRNGGACTRGGCHCPEGFTGAECEIRSCKNITPPANGLVSCFTFNKQRVCTLFCKHGYQFTNIHGNPYICGEDGLWNNDRSGEPIPDCSKIQGWSIVAGLDTEYKFNGSCEALSDEMRKKIDQKAASKAAALVGCSGTEQCHNTKLSAKTLICGQGARRKRSSSGSDAGTTDLEYDVAAEGNKAMFLQKYCGLKCRNKVTLYIANVNSTVNNLDNALNSGTTGPAFEAANFTLTYVQQSSTRSNLKFTCPRSGQVRQGTRCLSCPPGTYFESNRCHWCPFSTYQPDEGQLNCIGCPDAKTTSTKGARSLDQCE